MIKAYTTEGKLQSFDRGMSLRFFCRRRFENQICLVGWYDESYGIIAHNLLNVVPS
jgi:hypothetical protein